MHVSPKLASVAAVLCLVFGGACDRVVATGETLVIAVGEAAFGSSANPDGEARPAVRVDPGGTLSVEGGEIFGGSVVFQQAAPGPGFQLADIGTAIDAVDSRVELSGGLMVTGAGVIFNGNDTLQIPIRPSALRVEGGSLLVTGGTVMFGELQQAPGFVPTTNVLVATRSVVEIAGGTFMGDVQLASSPAVIRGGSFRNLLVGTGFGQITIQNNFAFIPDTNRFDDPQTCTEVRGGAFQRIRVQGGQTVVFFGQFTLPFGPTSVFTFKPVPIVFGPVRPPSGPPPTRLVGTLESGSSVELDVLTEPSGIVMLAPPGGPGCP